MAFDPKSEASTGIVKHLREDEVGWLVTVHEGAPRPVPVWFLWDGGSTLLVYSSPKALKVKTVARHRQCSFHFNSTEHGGDVVILYGRIQRAQGVPPALENGPYVAKYAEPVKQLQKENGTSPEEFSDEYSVPLVMTIEDARAW